jgi:hypothetical protein
MDLILWRHAEAVDHPDLEHGVPGDAQDLARRLTPRGEKQAARMAAWLDRQLPNGARVLSSPAQRTEQTALAMGRKFKLRDELLPAPSRRPCWNCAVARRQVTGGGGRSSANAGPGDRPAAGPERRGLHHEKGSLCGCATASATAPGRR